MSDQQLTEELHNQITKKIQEKKVHSPFIDNLRGAQNTDMQLISKFNKGVHFLLSVTDIFSNYFQQIWKSYYNYQCFAKNSKESNRKPNKIWVD